MIPLDPEYGPARTIPHPIMFRVLDAEADDVTIPANLAVEKGAEYAYYPGCIDYYDQEMQFSHLNYGDTDHGIIFDSSIKLLKAVGIEPVILDRSFMKCCGHDQLWQGKVDVFQRMRDYNTKIIRMLGVKTLVTSCAEGYRTFKLDYNLKGVDVKHITQVLYEKGLRLPPPKEGKTIRVTYQDPCRSCRQMPVDPIYEEPRELVRRVQNAELVELKTFRADAQCCGVAQMMYCNDKTKGLTASRMDEAKGLDVDYLLTACPKCLTHFGCLHHENRWKPEEERYRYRVIDITHFLAERLEGETIGKAPSVIPIAQDPRQKAALAAASKPAPAVAATSPPKPAAPPTPGPSPAPPAATPPVTPPKPAGLAAPNPSPTPAVATPPKPVPPASLVSPPKAAAPTSTPPPPSRTPTPPPTAAMPSSPTPSPPPSTPAAPSSPPAPVVNPPPSIEEILALRLEETRRHEAQKVAKVKTGGA